MSSRDSESRRSMEESFRRLASGVETRKTRLNLEKAREIRRLFAEGWRQVDLAHRFHVNENLISNVIHNRSWREDGQSIWLRLSELNNQ